MDTKQRTQKEIVSEIMESAVEDAGGGETHISARDLYYSVRNRYLAHPDRPQDKDGLQYHYFSTKLLPDYQHDHGPIEGLVRDPRGHLYEPHSGTTLELGTAALA